MDRLPIDSSLGERIRYYRQAAGMTQKALAEKCSITESAIRNYELGNRMPDWETLTDIAENLKVSFYALSDPRLADIFGALHALFRMEDIYGIHPVMVGNDIHIAFSKDTYAKNLFTFSPDTLLKQAITVWESNYLKYINGDISEEEYQTWRSKYPEFSAPDCSLPSSETENSKNSIPDKTQKRFRRPKKNT